MINISINLFTSHADLKINNLQENSVQDTASFQDSGEEDSVVVANQLGLDWAPFQENVAPYFTLVHRLLFPQIIKIYSLMNEEK